MDFSEFETKVSKGKGVRRAVSIQARRYIDNEYTNYCGYKTKARDFIEKIEEKTGLTRRRRKTIESQKSTKGDDKITCSYETLISDWGRENEKRRGDFKFAVVTFFYFFNYVDEISYAKEIGKVVWGEKSSLYRKMFGIEEAIGSCNGDNEKSLVLPDHLSQPPLWLPEEEYLDEDNSNWLNPAVVDALPFIGRAKELKQLTDFATSDNNFQVWALSGPSGAGKTRLAINWMREFRTEQKSQIDNVFQQWHIGFLDQSTQESWKEKWDTWVPEQPTFIVIDYIYKSQEIIDQLIKRWRPPNDNELQYPVRLLLIDHIFPTNLEDILKDPRFRSMSSGGMDWENKKELFFAHKPLELGKEEHTREYLTDIMEAGARIFGKDLDETEITIGLKELEETTAAWCPLFAALKGYALAKNSYSKFGDRRDLIKFYLDTTNRLPWLADNAEDRAIGLAVGNFVSVATLIRNASLKVLVHEFLKHEFVGADWREEMERIIVRSWWIVSNRDKNTLYAFEPDILGESFFLEFYHHIKYPIDQSATFIDLLSQICNYDDRYIKVSEFIEFFQRISRNLADDNQQDPKIIMYWEMFLDFLNHEDFPENTPIRKAVAIVTVNIILMLENCGQDELVKKCLPE